MSKDPAILFYTSDFLSGTAFFTDEQRGQYIKLLCEQHQNGHIPEQHMIDICKTYDSPVLKKFKKDNNGLYYQERMDKEIEKRSLYSESRRKNRFSKKEKIHMSDDMSNDMYGHMDNGNGNGIDYDNIIENYHILCPKMNKVQVISKIRKEHINARINEFTIEKFTTVLRLAGESQFLNGDNDKVWKADFDWIIKPNNFIKILEGKYTKTTQKPKFVF